MKAKSFPKKRNQMKYSIIILLTFFVFAGCGEKKENTPEETGKDKFAYDSTDLKTTTLKDANSSLTFKYKFEKGEKYSYRVTTLSEDQQLIKADTTIEQNVKQNVVYLLNFEPAEIEGDGTQELTCTIASIKLDAASNDQKISYNSDAKKDSAETVKYSEYESMVNNPFSVRISSNGEILEIFRVDKILTKYLEIKGFADSLSAQQKTMVREDLISGVLRPLVIQIFREMPAKSVAKDSSWTIPQNPQRFMIYQITNTNVYRVASLEDLDGDTLVKMHAQLDTKISGDSKVTDRGVTYEFQKPVTSADGTIYFNLTDGMVEKSKTGTTIEIFYTMEANTPQGKQKGSRKEKIRNVNIVERL
jgi:hypothetical protein